MKPIRPYLSSSYRLRLSLQEIAKILVIGPATAIISFFILEVATAQFFETYILAYFEEGDNLIVGLLILAFFGIAMLVSIIAGVLITDDMKKLSVLKASLMGFLTSLFIVIVIAYIFVHQLYPEFFFENISEWFDYFILFPNVIVVFAIYVLDSLFYLYVIVVLSYFIIFTIYLEIYYEYPEQKFPKFYNEMW